MIRPATIHDVEAINRIYNYSVVNNTGTFDSVEKTIESQIQWFHAHKEMHPIFVLELEKVVCGYSCLNPWSDRAAYSRTVENSLYLYPDYQGRGYGSSMLKHLITTARDLNHHTIIAKISTENSASVHMHQKLGFETIGVMREVGFKFKRCLDVTLMQILLFR